MTHRLTEIDFIKGFGILLVLIGHSGISGFPYVWIYGFHMPLFFIVSGLFYKRKSFREFTISNCRRLLFPWIIFAFILTLVTLVHSLLFNGSIHDDVVKQLNPFDESSRCLYLSIWFFIKMPILIIVTTVLSLLLSKFLTKLFPRVFA